MGTTRRRANNNIEVDLPTEVTNLLGPTPSEAVACLKQLALIELFRRGEVSSGYAAEVLGMSRWDFIMLLGQHGIEYLTLDDDELIPSLQGPPPTGSGRTG